MYSSPNFEPFGRLFSFGWNNGQLGSKSSSNKNEPSLVEGFDNIRLCACGGSHTIIVTDDNKMYSCGRNKFGQLGVGDEEDRETFTEVKCELFSIEDQFISVACGDQFSIALTENGKVFCFGKNFGGQLGLGENRGNFLVPTKNVFLSSRNIRRIACGARHALFLTDKGEIFSCGWGKFGQLGHGDNLDQRIPKLIDYQENGGEHFQGIEICCKDCLSMCLSSSYEVLIWGGKVFKEHENGTIKKNEMHQNVPRKLFGNLLGRRIIDVSCSSQHGLVLTSDGSVFSFGYSLEKLGYEKYIEPILESFREDQKKKKKELPPSAQELKEEGLILDDKHIIPAQYGFTLYKNHFLPKNEVVQVCCGESVNYCVTKHGDVLSWGKSDKGDLGQGDKVWNVLKPKKIEWFAKNNVKVGRIVTGSWHSFVLEGTEYNIQHRHLNIGQKIPKVLDRLPKGRSKRI